jgi:uncharacterized protein YbaP (TraB family)
MTDHEVNLDTVELDRLASDNETIEVAIKANYNAVLSTISELKAKEIAPYLTELGFDVSEFENRTPQMLAAKIEPSFLLPQEKAS